MQTGAKSALHGGLNDNIEKSYIQNSQEKFKKTNVKQKYDLILKKKELNANYVNDNNT